MSKAEFLQKAETLRRDEFNWNDIGSRCETILRLIQKKDAVAIKNAYRMLFEAIIVGDLGADGTTELHFILRGENDDGFSGNGNGRTKFRLGNKMAREERLKPPTR